MTTMWMQGGGALREEAPTGRMRWSWPVEVLEQQWRVVTHCDQEVTVEYVWRPVPKAEQADG